jgi:cytochrome d ubiquinol oxidase subunit I
MTYAGWIATLAGWYVTEIGRQPWLVYGLLAAADTVAPHPPAKVAGTLVAYAVLYTFLLISYVLTLRYLATKPAKSLRMLQLPALSPVTEPR